MSDLRLLIIEDDKDFRDSYEKQIKLFNLDQDEVSVKVTYAINEENAKNELANGQFDAAIVDMKLGNTDVIYIGNELLEIIKSNLRFPVFVLTSNPEKIEEEKGNENDLYKIKVKGTEESNFTTILEELKKIHLTGITKILGKSGQIEKYLNEIFWKHLSSSVNVWASDASRNSDQKEKSLLRFTLSHVQEHLDLTETGGFEHYTPSEFYISPPIKPNLFTGDIIKYNGKRCIVLTPACDIGRKAENVLFVSIRNWDDVDPEFLKRPISGNKKGDLKNLIGNKIPRYHFIPKTAKIDAGFVDFQNKMSLTSERINDLLEKKKAVRIATVAAPFLKDIISRYSTYYSRQGSPDFEIEEVYNSLF